MSIKYNIHGLIQAWKINHKTNICTPIFTKDFHSYKKNLAPTQYLEDIAKMATGTSFDGEFKYVAVSTAFDPPTKLTSLELEKGRVEPTSVTRVGAKIIVEAEFGISDANTASTTIDSVISNKIVTIADATGFNIGDRVIIGTAKEERKITNLGVTITLDKDLKITPSNGTTFKQALSRLHLVYGSGATLSLNSGYGASIAQLISTKTSTETIVTRHEIEYIG
jgi:hypothetical protein